MTLLARWSCACNRYRREIEGAAIHMGPTATVCSGNIASGPGCLCTTSNLNPTKKVSAQLMLSGMAVDKEAIIILCLSRVYSYYFKCNFPLFYVYLALTRYLSILFLNILILLACTHSSDNLFHTLMALCENEHFLTSNLLCFFTRVKLCPLVILLSLISKKKVRINIFITI